MTDNSTYKLPSKRLRWSWFPSLLFGDGMLLSVFVLTMLMLRRYGVNMAQTTLYLALLCLPIVLRPLLETAVTYFHDTTKVWVLSAEFISALSIWAIAFTLPTGYWLQGVLCFMPFVVTAGVFYNIATQRFYLDTIETNPRQHYWALLFRCFAALFGIGTLPMLAGNMEVVTRNVRYSWSLVFYIMAGVEFFLWLWHSIFLPGGKRPWAEEKDLFGLHPRELKAAVKTTLQGWRNHFMLLFGIIFILPEVFLSIVLPLFIVDAPHNGGLGLAPQEFGLAFGTIAVIAMATGITIASKAMRRLGTRYCVLPMALTLCCHGIAALYLSSNTSASLALVCTALFGGYFSFGIGLTAYSSVMRQFEFTDKGSSLRHSLTLALIALTVMAVNLFTGLLQKNIGYRQFFSLTVAMYALTILIAAVYTILSSRMHNPFKNDGE